MWRSVAQAKFEIDGTRQKPFWGENGMGLPVLKEKRGNPRRPLMGDLTGRLLVGWSGRSLPCLAVDVSPGGLRVLLREQLPTGTSMFLSFDGSNVPLTIVWCQRDADSRESFAFGLLSVRGIDLERFFVSIGWLDDHASTEAWLRSLDFVNIADE